MSSFVYLSKASKITNAPLLVMLHGYSSNEADLFSFASLIPSDYHSKTNRCKNPQSPVKPSTQYEETED
jgi:predicted esterase